MKTKFSIIFMWLFTILLYRVINWTFILKTVCLQPPISRMKRTSTV